MNLINPIEVLLKPEKFLDKKSSKILDLTKYILVITLLPAIVFALATIVLIPYLQAIPLVQLFVQEQLSAYSGATYAVIVFLIVMASSLISFFAGGFLVHMFAKLFGGKKKYNDTLNAFAASMTPTLLLMWIPFVNVLAVIQSVVVMIVGLGKKQNISIPKSCLAVWTWLMIVSVILPVIAYYGGLTDGMTLQMLNALGSLVPLAV